MGVIAAIAVVMTPGFFVYAGSALGFAVIGGVFCVFAATILDQLR
jgi:hypothetical protein